MVTTPDTENQFIEVLKMLPLATTPRIAKQDRYWLSYQIRSRTRSDKVHTLLYSEGGSYDCGCEAFKWGSECWHMKMTTLRRAEYTRLGHALEQLKDRTKKPVFAWNDIGCTFREFYKGDSIYCKGCPVYPELCNVHPITYSRQKKPLIWKIQTALIRGKRKEATRLLRQFIKRIADEKAKLADFYESIGWR